MSGVSQGKISKIENGTQQATVEQIESLASAYGVTSAFFKSDEFDLVAVPSLYRRRQMRKGRLKTFQAIEHILRMSVERLLESIEIDPSLRLPRQEPGFDPIKMAQRLRQDWMIPRGPIPNLTTYLEAAGVLVLPLHGMPDEISAVFLPPVNGLSAIFVVNPAMPGDRLRITLAHELGHYILEHQESQRGGDCEDEAWAFAQELLMPAAQIRTSLRGLKMKSALDLKRHWGVSIKALVKRAEVLGSLSPSKSNSMYIEISRRGWLREEPVSIAQEQPKILRQVINHHLGPLGYSTSELAEALRLSEERLYSLFGALLPNKFRIV